MRRLITVLVPVAMIALGAAVAGSAAPARAEVPKQATAPSTTADIAARAEAWIRRHFKRRPALMIGLAAIAAIPPLALAGLVLYRRRPQPRHEQPAEQRSTPDERASVLAFSTGSAAWLEVSGTGRVALSSERDIIQIGRQADNDIRLEGPSVEHYHALIERSDREGFTIIDVSSPDGVGIRINGERRMRWRLADGDTVEIGRARLRFGLSAAA